MKVFLPVTFVAAVGVAAAIPLAAGLWTFAGTPQASAEETQKPLYYRNPMRPWETSPVPEKDHMGMDYIPVYEKDSTPPPNGQKRNILHYRNPMGLPDTSPVPKKDSMGMDYLPVYEGDAATPPPS